MTHESQVPPPTYQVFSPFALFLHGHVISPCHWIFVLGAGAPWIDGHWKCFEKKHVLRGAGYKSTIGYTLLETNSKSPGPKRKRLFQYSSHPFSGAKMLVSGRVYIYIITIYVHYSTIYVFVVGYVFAVFTFVFADVTVYVSVVACANISRWWFQTFFIFTPIWGRFPFWLIFFRLSYILQTFAFV